MCIRDRPSCRPTRYRETGCLKPRPPRSLQNLTRLRRETFLTWIVRMASDIHDTLGLTPGSRRKRFGRWIIAALVIVALALVLIRMRAAPAQAASPYKTEAVQQGALTVSVTATGELKPVTQVNIGTEISVPILT